MFYSGEFHPFRLPVPGLWLDVFQKIKALGYTGVSFYVDWRLLEGTKGQFTAEGVFAFEPFFEAAAEAGLYLLARPGPYINAEVAGGGFPGWLQREPAILRTNETGYVEATRNYVENIGKLIADAQITNGGPVIALQVENEYTYGASWVKWPDVEYIEAANELYREAGIVVPFINNEASPIGLFTPGEPGGPDIYGHDSYPVGWTCEHLVDSSSKTMVVNRTFQAAPLPIGLLMLCPLISGNCILNRVRRPRMRFRSSREGQLLTGVAPGTSTSALLSSAQRPSEYSTRTTSPSE